MRKKALVVVQKDECFGQIDEAIFSLDHIYDHACCQEEARWLLNFNWYDYILADLFMSVRWMQQRRAATCLNFLDEVETTCTDRRIPIILVVERSVESALAAMEVILMFASNIKKAKTINFVEKPFPTVGRTLDSVIRNVVPAAMMHAQPPAEAAQYPAWASNAFREATTWQAANAPAGWLRVQQMEAAVIAPTQTAAPVTGEARAPQPFTRGELMLYPDHAELLGVKIISDTGTGLSLKALEVLDARMPSGHWRGFSAHMLAKLIGADSEAAAIGCISTLRDNIVERLLKHRDLACERDGVIQNDDVRGYHYRDGIVVQRVHRDAPAVIPDGQAEVEQGVAQRRHKVLAILTKRPMRVPEIASCVGVTTKTVHRTLDGLKQDGLIEFVGPPKTGCYRIKRKGRPSSKPSAPN
jgi:hypothetical protein